MGPKRPRYTHYNFRLSLQGRQLLWHGVRFPAHKVPTEKRSTLKGKNLLPIGSKFFPFRVDTFFKREANTFDRVVSPESVSVLLNFSYKGKHVMQRKQRVRIAQSITENQAKPARSCCLIRLFIAHHKNSWML